MMSCGGGAAAVAVHVGGRFLDLGILGLWNFSIFNLRILKLKQKQKILGSSLFLSKTHDLL